METFGFNTFHHQTKDLCKHGGVRPIFVVSNEKGNSNTEFTEQTRCEQRVTPRNAEDTREASVMWGIALNKSDANELEKQFHELYFLKRFLHYYGRRKMNKKISLVQARAPEVNGKKARDATQHFIARWSGKE